ncbi:MAG: DUF6056 family protein [Lachnospiraceae bacterium]|nr:DUF6056 family protein [Lachnospiraceae bacterium]
MNEKKRQRLFVTLIFINFATILIYNTLTPYMSDDLWYDLGVMRPFADIIKDQIEDHMTWSGRDVGHLILKLSFCFPKWIFNIANSIMFVWLTLLMYLSIERTKKYDPYSYGLIVTMMWLSGVAFDQTILWVSGACNYLWPGVIIMGFITVYRNGLNVKSGDTADSRVTSAIKAVMMCILGLLAGWSNENTSGGAILLVSLMIIDKVRGWKKENDEVRLPAWCITGIIGAMAGFILMITAPGNFVRSEVNLSEEGQTGVMALLGRLLKINDYVMDDFGILICIIVILLVYNFVKGSAFDRMKYIGMYLVTAILTVYVLVLTATPMDRALFGAGVLLIICCVQLISDIPKTEELLTAIKYGSVIILALYLALVYLKCGADLVRINRELGARQQYVEEQKKKGEFDLILPQLREEWDNRYTFIYHCNDIDDDPESYGNKIYKVYYGLDNVIGIPYEEWENNYRE